MNDCISRINSYLHDDMSRLPLFVNVENAEQKTELVDYYNVGENTIVHISDFAKKDSLPNIMGMIDYIKKSEGNIFVLGLTTYLRLLDRTELSRMLTMLSEMSIKGKVVFFCFHCEESLKNLVQNDLRVAQRITSVDITDEYKKPQITFIAPAFSLSSINIINGIEKLAEAIEDSKSGEVIIRTSKQPNLFQKGQYAIDYFNTSLKILQQKYSELNSFSYCDQEAEYWDYLLNISAGKESFKSIILAHFGDTNSYEYSLQEWYSYEDKKQWLLFLSMKLFPDTKNRIIRTAVEKATKYQNIVRCVMRSILEYDFDSKVFLETYKQWRSLRYRMSIPEEEISDYCEYIDYKGKDAIYYISDLTKIEKEKAIKTIGFFQEKFDDATLLAILKNQFPDFYDYVSPFFFNNMFLDQYFSRYNMQKFRNTIYPDFEVLVEKEAQEQHYVELPTRAEIIGDIDKKESVVFFVDALGVEFLNYILRRCTEKGLFAEPKVGKCNLPSITETNKEFLDVFKANNAEIVDFIKQIDKDKHEAIGDYNFEKSEYPIHLIDELAVIDRILSNISSKLSSNKYRQAYIVSDHGASRLAVIKKSILPIESNRTGTHGGRVCENNELTKNLQNAIHEGDLCILAGYDRFDGSRPAAVETHGGATLEEVVVPVIRITQSVSSWEIKVMNENNRVMFSYKTKPVLVLWSKTEVENMVIKLNGKPYVGIMSDDKKTFKFYLDAPEKACDCLIEVYVSGNMIKDNIRIRLEREGMQKSKGFGNMLFGGSDN